MVVDHKGVYDVRPMYRDIKDVVGKRHSVSISYGEANFHSAFAKEFYYDKRDSRHINYIHLKRNRNRSKMERLNSETRDREKVMRGLRTKNTLILRGYQIYHNYVRPQEA